MTEQVTLVVPSRGGAQRLPRLLAALRLQTHPTWDAVVVLDGDIDGSQGAVAAAVGDLPVRTLVFPENRGRSAALNAGFEAAGGDILVRCDDDLDPRPDYVARHVAAHDPTQPAGGVIGLYRNVFPETPYAAKYGRAADENLRTGAYTVGPAQRWRYWAGNVSVRREVWEEVGPYDGAFRAYGWEDVDWGYRLHRLGHPIRIDPTLETDHHILAVSTSGRVLRAYYSGSARRRFEAKHGFVVVPPPALSPWGLAVRVAARALTENRLVDRGQALDSLTERLPSPVAARFVALMVEAAAVAGHARHDAGQAI
jgi:glycosyltransferase involved in cell wall biosynthesis